jgi:hypothetical protein
MKGAPDCYQCVYRKELPGDCHSACSNEKASVKGSTYGILMGWFAWPFNFDPKWLVACDGFSPPPERAQDTKSA